MDHKSSSERLADSLERARRHWQARRQAGVGEESPLPRAPAFTIAISREAGADGPRIARAVADRLGWPVYDQELLKMIAEEMGLRSKLLESVDEKRGNWMRECVEALVSAPHVSASAYVRHLVETLLSLATHGECVIVGRGAGHVLPRDTTLSVRLVAPVEERTTVIRQRFGIAYEEAARWIDKTDRERARFVKEFFQKDSTDPRLYDLVLNTSRYTAEECAGIIVEALRCLQARVKTREGR